MSEAASIGRGRYADLYGPTAGDRVRLADTNLFIEITEDQAQGRAGAGDLLDVTTCRGGHR